MVYVIAVLFAGFIAMITMAISQLAPARPAVVTKRLQELAEIGDNPFDIQRRRERHSRRKRLEGVLEALGQRVQKAGVNPALQSRLIHAGFRGPNAARVYVGARIGIPVVLFAGIALLIPAFGTQVLAAAGFAAGLGWIAPEFYLGSKVRNRQKELTKALPDALDSMVVCVEAGLGLNQAMVRVSDEIRHISPLMSDELTLTNLEIRAGTPREEAMRNLAERTGLPDIRSLVTMLIQTERFGTSIAQALRVQSDTLREKRKQRAEEAAAKTSIKMLFPLIFFIFPAMFVVTLGPPLIKLIENWGNAPV